LFTFTRGLHFMSELFTIVYRCWCINEQAFTCCEEGLHITTVAKNCYWSSRCKEMLFLCDRLEVTWFVQSVKFWEILQSELFQGIYVFARFDGSPSPVGIELCKIDVPKLWLCCPNHGYVMVWYAGGIKIHSIILHAYWAAQYVGRHPSVSVWCQETPNMNMTSLYIALVYIVSYHISVEKCRLESVSVLLLASHFITMTYSFTTC